jgi:hypothetical protein
MGTHRILLLYVFTCGRHVYRPILISLDPWWPLSTTCTVVHTYKLQILNVHRKTLSHRLSLNDPSNTIIVNFKVPSPTLEHLYMHKTPLAKHSCHNTGSLSSTPQSASFTSTNAPLKFFVHRSILATITPCGNVNVLTMGNKPFNEVPSTWFQSTFLGASPVLRGGDLGELREPVCLDAAMCNACLQTSVI